MSKQLEQSVEDRRFQVGRIGGGQNNLESLLGPDRV